MPHCSVRDRRTKKTDWPPIAGSWGHSSVSILLFMLFALLEVKRLLLCLITSQVRSVLTAQTESRRLLESICQNTDSATGTRALFPAFDLWHLIICRVTLSTEQLPPIHESYRRRIFLIKAPFPEAFVWRSSPLRIWSEARLPSNFRWLWIKPWKQDFSADLSSLQAGFNALPHLCKRDQQLPCAAGMGKLWFAPRFQIWLLLSWSVKGLWHVVHGWTDDLFDFYSFARLNLICVRIGVIISLRYTYIVNITNVLGRGSKISQCFRKSNM